MPSPHRNDGPVPPVPLVPPVGAQVLYDDGTWADAVVRSANASTGTAATLTARPLRDRPGALLSGSCDLDTRAILGAALGVVTRIPGPVVHLDLSAVAFLDTAAVAALVQANATVAGQGRRLLLHHPPYSLRKLVEMFPDECAALEVAA
ncbi:MULTISPECIES: STAS domain-containing protein [unclassified Streptomyces]|uniref:STAS domain-containing protein n=1 Tax=unclassified Streptomyces TaxID=2593676 RepID=UPI002E0FB912|nr:STAS domain-containing protein [Streptomyces sp. NBC_01207]WTA23715.1 STAS domain-containing protein [Streptomyces sp. NBC_00853]